VNVLVAIVSVPERAMPVFGDTVKFTAPLPVPAPPDVTVSQGTLLTAVQLQDAPEVTDTGGAGPPAASADRLLLDNVKVHVDGGGGGGVGGGAGAGGAGGAGPGLGFVGGEDAASCDTVNVCPAIASVPVRAPAVFVATVNCKVPGPVPLEAPTIDIHVAFETAFQVHPEGVLIVIGMPLPPADGTVCEVGVIEAVHEGAPP
jgi:hypothetical protein